MEDYGWLMPILVILFICALPFIAQALIGILIGLVILFAIAKLINL